MSAEGIFLSSRYRLKYSYHLFAVRRLFVEVWREYPGKDLVFIRGFTSTIGLLPYLDLIDITPLLMDLN